MVTYYYETYGWLIPLLGGAYSTYLGYRGVKKGDKPEYEDWYMKFGKSFTWLGPLVFLFGIFQYFVP